MIKIATWNVNSVRARLSHLCSWLQESKPDIVLLQEVKVLTELFPYESIEDCGYNIAVYGQKSYNGVAILSRFPIEDVVLGLPGDHSDSQCRYIEAFTGGVRVSSVYVPNGQAVGTEKFQYKMNFMERLRYHLEKLLQHKEAVLVGGDYNITFNDMDVYEAEKWREQILCSTIERDCLTGLLKLGYHDTLRILRPHDIFYTWWDYRQGMYAQNKGLRIDHILGSSEVLHRILEGGVDQSMRGLSSPSDHAPVWLSLAKS